MEANKYDSIGIYIKQQNAFNWKESIDHASTALTFKR